MITLSVIIVNYNTKNLTLKCLDSIWKSDTETPLETIVIDNNSTDGSRDALQGLRNIELINNNENLGFAKAVNQGIAKARGSYYLLLNSDVVVKKGAIDTLISFVKGREDVGAIGPKLLNIDGSAQSCVYNFPSVTNAIKEYWLGRKGAYDKYLPKGDGPSEVDAIVMTSLLITPQGFKKAGYLNEKYFMYFEDLDYCRKLHQENLKVIYFPDAEVIHHHGASGKNVADSANQWRRLIPSSKVYNGLLKHYLLYVITWSGQKFRKLFSLK